MTIQYTEFKTSVTVWSLEEPDYQPCPELDGICQLISAPKITGAPTELYSSTDQLLSVSSIDKNCFLRIDMAKDPTDQMEVVLIEIRCHADVSSSIDSMLRSIRSRSEVKTAYLQGNLGLSPDIVQP